MGLLEAVYKVVYKADTTDLTRGLKGLQGDEKKLQEQRILAANEYNKAIESQIDRLKSYQDIIGGVAKIAKGAFDLIEFSGKRADLSAAAAGVSIEGLRKATLGLRTDTELLGTAAKLNHSVFQLNQQDMEIAARAMTALGERGGDAEEAINAVTDALVTGKTKGLKAYGIEIDETKDKATKYKEIMAALKTVSGEVSEATLDQSDSVSQLKVNFANSIDRMKDSIGQLAMSLEPLLAALAKAVGLIADVVEGAKITDDVRSLILNRNATVGGQVMGDLAVANDKLLRERIAGIGGLSGLRGGGTAGAVNTGLLKQASGGRGVSRYGDYARLGGIDVQDNNDLGFNYGSLGSRAGESSSDLQGMVNAQAAMYEAERNSRESRYADFNKGKEQSFLQSTFGSIDEFNLYAQGFQMLTGAVGASLTAWIDGSMSAGQAFKKFIGEALKGLAVQMSIEALKHGAYALGSLAFGDFRGAAQHGQAALAFGAGAALAAVTAREFGSGAKSAPSAKAPNVSGGGGGGGARGPERIIVYGDSFAEDSPRGRQRQAKRMIARAQGNSSVEVDS